MHFRARWLPELAQHSYYFRNGRSLAVQVRAEQSVDDREVNQRQAVAESCGAHDIPRHWTLLVFGDIG